MKYCAGCGSTLNDNAFAWKNELKGHRQTYCRDCQKVYQKRWYKHNRERHIANVAKINQVLAVKQRELLFTYLSKHPCVDCGETDILVLEFDHRYGKRSCVTTLVGRCNWKKVEREIEKCDVRCANCHTRRTAIQKKSIRLAWKLARAAVAQG